MPPPDPAIEHPPRQERDQLPGAHPFDIECQVALPKNWGEAGNAVR
jgi:hypothetical protein